MLLSSHLTISLKIADLLDWNDKIRRRKDTKQKKNKIGRGEAETLEKSSIDVIYRSLIVCIFVVVLSSYTAAVPLYVDITYLNKRKERGELNKITKEKEERCILK